MEEKVKCFALKKSHVNISCKTLDMVFCTLMYVAPQNVVTTIVSSHRRAKISGADGQNGGCSLIIQTQNETVTTS